jgi:hypothetical protein
MDDIYDTENNEENLKSKNIRRILLLKTDKDLKAKKKTNLRINTKTIQELNKSYDLYNTLLSEKSKIYFNYVKTEEKIFPTNIKTVKTYRIVSPKKKMEKPVKILNITTTIEDEYSNSLINFCPKKIDLGIKKNNIPRRRSKNFTKLPDFFDNLHLDNTSRNKEEINRSTEVVKRGLYKLVDKIINIKMSEDIEDMVKKNILKLRKYCNKLKKKKKKIRKANRQKEKDTTPKKSKEKTVKNAKRKNVVKRLTISDNKNFFKKSLFGSRGGENDFIKKRTNLRMKTTKNLEILHFETEQNQKDNKIKHPEGKTLTSTVLTKNLKSSKKTKYSKKKLKIRKMQSLNNVKNKLLERKGLKLYKNTDGSNRDEPVISPFNIIFSVYNNNPIKAKSKFKPLFDKNTSRNSNSRGKKPIVQSNIFTSTEKKNDFRRSMRKTQNLSIKLYDKWIDLN